MLLGNVFTFVVAIFNIVSYAPALLIAVDKFTYRFKQSKDVGYSSTGCRQLVQHVIIVSDKFYWPLHP